MPAILVRVSDGMDEMERARIWHAIGTKWREPFPTTLRQALGRSIIERPFRNNYEHQNSDRRLLALDDGPKPMKGRGMSSQAPPKEALYAPWRRKIALCQSLAIKMRLIRLSPRALWARTMSRISYSTPIAIRTLSFELVSVVERENLLRGYSSAAVVGGCLHFAAFALDLELLQSGEEMEDLDCGFNFHAMRCAYNALWLERYQLEEIVKKRGGSLEELSLPVAPSGGVSAESLEVDARRRAGLAVVREERVQKLGKRAALKRLLLRCK